MYSLYSSATTKASNHLDESPCSYHILRIADLELSSTLITQSVRSGAGNDLRLTSPTHSVSIDGPQRLGIRSFGGGINIEAAKDIKIRANNNGKVIING